jgi:hypothetical protein
MAAVPELNRADMLSGEYFAAWESWFSDHVFRRDSWLKSYVWWESKLLRRVVVNDVVLGDEVLLPYFPAVYTPPPEPAKDAAAMADSLARLQAEIAAYGGQFLYLVPPEQYSLFRDDYPAYLNDNSARLEAARQVFFTALEREQVPYIELRPLLLAAEDYRQYYFSGDHHYNLRGAFYAYQLLCERLPGLTAHAGEFRFQELPNPFYGSRCRKLYGVSAISDSLLVYDTDNAPRFTRFDNGEQVAATVFALPQTETERLQYTLYMGGDIAETVIETNRPELPDILLFGDSFTNALETFLYLSADTFRSVDLRYYQQMSLTEYVKLYQPDIVICMRDDNSILLSEGNGAF